MPRLATILVAALAVCATATPQPAAPRRALMQAGGLLDALTGGNSAAASPPTSGGGGAKPPPTPAPGGGAKPPPTPPSTTTPPATTTPPPTARPPTPNNKAADAPAPSSGGGGGGRSPPPAPPPAAPALTQHAQAPAHHSPAQAPAQHTPSPAPAASPPARSPTSAPAPSPSSNAPAPSPGNAPAPAPSNGKAFDGGVVPPPPPGKPSGPPPVIDKQPEKGKDDGKGSDFLPSDASAASDTRGAKTIDPTKLGIKAAGSPQPNVSGKNLLTGTPIDINSVKDQAGAKTTAAVSFTGDLNAGANGLPKPQLTGVPAYGGGGGPVGTYGITWLNTNVFTVGRTVYGNDWGLGWDSTELVTVVLDNWAAKVDRWGSYNPVFRAPSVGFTFAFGRWEYLWYAFTYGSWGWKTPAMGLTMYDDFGNTLQVSVQAGINLRNFDVVSVRVVDYYYSGNNWGR